MYHRHGFGCPNMCSIKERNGMSSKYFICDVSRMWLTKCAPCCTSVCARLAGQGCANAAKCRGVFPASSIEFGSAPTVKRAFTSCGDGNWHAG